MAALSKGGTFKGYSKSELGSMAQGITLPTDFTSNTAFDYKIPKITKKAKEKAVEGLTIE